MGKNNSNINNIIKKIKQYEKSGKDVSMVVQNIKTEKEGVAILTKDNNIAVFEGKEDGSDDRIYSLEEFNKNYKIVRLENEYEDEIILDVWFYIIFFYWR